MPVKKITRGLDKIEIGDVAVDGGPGTSLAALGLSDRDSAVTLIEEEPTIDRLYAHETDEPLDVEVTGGTKQLLFTVVDPDLDTLAKIFGGTVTGTGATATYELPTSKAILDQTVKVTPRKGLIITMARAAVYGKINADFAKAAKFAVDIVAEALQPAKAGVGSLTFGPEKA